ncbi:unnamed protein product [Somion occarium]|uniref:Secreted protein n=1 Tax=Somion occarium TaxID=3059160 RepID=A0ABP1CNG7_9APHY
MMLGFCILLASFLPALAFAIPVAPTVEPEVSGCILVDLGDFVIKDDGTKLEHFTMDRGVGRSPILTVMRVAFVNRIENHVCLLQETERLGMDVLGLCV